MEGRGGVHSGEEGAATVASPGMSSAFGAAASVVVDWRSALAGGTADVCVEGARAQRSCGVNSGTAWELFSPSVQSLVETGS